MQAINTIEPVKQISQYMQIPPVMEAMRANNEHRPNNSFPVDIQGTIQQNTHSIPPIAVYNSKGALIKNNPKTLLGYA